MSKITALGKALVYFDEQLEDVSLGELDQRRNTGFGLLAAASYHAKGIHYLLDAQFNLHAPAFALIRILKETFVRGMWILFCSSDEQIVRYLDDQGITRNQKNKRGKYIEIPYREIVSQLECEVKYSGIVSQLTTENWGTYCNYTHGGPLQVSMHLQGNAITPSFPQEEIDKLIFHTALFAILSFMQVLEVSDSKDKNKTIEHSYELLKPIMNLGTRDKGVVPILLWY